MHTSRTKKTGPWRAPYAKYYEDILKLLREGATYQNVSDWLRIEHGIIRAPNTIWDFIDVRLRKGRFGPDYGSASNVGGGPVDPKSTHNTDSDAYEAARARIKSSQRDLTANGPYIDPSQVYPDES